MTRHGGASGGFEGFVREHSRSLFGTAYLLTGGRLAAEELVQDTLAALYPQWLRVTSADKPLAYVRRALTNRFLTQRSSGAARETAVWEIPDSLAGPDVAQTVADQVTLWQSLQLLPERQRAAIVLHYFHGLTDLEVAGVLGCRRGTARSLISRGLVALRVELHQPARHREGAAS